MAQILKVHPSDNIVVALQDLKKGQELEVNEETIVLKSDIPLKHKFSQKRFQTGDEIIMYGVLVGKAMKDIEKGDIIATHNIKHAASDINPWKKQQLKWDSPDVDKFKGRTFSGFLRDDGQVGTANYLDPSAAGKIARGIADYAERHGFERVADLTGALETG